MSMDPPLFTFPQTSQNQLGLLHLQSNFSPSTSSVHTYPLSGVHLHIVIQIYGSSVV